MVAADKAYDYLEENDLIEIISPKNTGKTAIEPVLTDLARLHDLIRTRKSSTVLEFGVGFSTLVMADALRKNKEERIDETGITRFDDTNNKYQVFSVDSSYYWISNLKNNIKEDLKKYIKIMYSDVYAGKYLGQLCHYYRNLPDVVPDFIYLDGPDPNDVQNLISGLSFKNANRTPISADILLYESTLLPSAYILVDGRTNNARFLQRNLKRQYDINWDRDNDVTTFELIEEPLSIKK